MAALVDAPHWSRLVRGANGRETGAEVSQLQQSKFRSPNMTRNELKRSVRSKLKSAIRAQRESWDMALTITEITGYAGDIYALVAETAGALEDDEAIPDDLVEKLVSSISLANLHPRPTSRKLRIQ
jgi:hypothetical protein